MSDPHCATNGTWDSEDDPEPSTPDTNGQGAGGEVGEIALTEKERAMLPAYVPPPLMSKSKAVLAARVAADRAERRAEVEELREDSHNAFQQVAEVARPLGISPDDAHPLDTIERVLAEREKDTAALRAEVERLSDIAMRNADLLIEADERNAALRERVEALDDSLCDALCAARSGKYDGKTVEVHLENLIARLRAALDAGGAGG